ncbi:hypothetical protein [Telluribacter sp.]|jgi:hypothetical protein|uniref:hypothetical protein n=1 Tax=Telluribacter sp. TaxID=1978767 RepID=UPI002E10248D|nr:hypothetical protein [Telluribacter sp.]
MTTAELNKIFKSKKQKVDKKTGKITQGFVNATFKDFVKWFDIDVFNQGCHYCGISNDKSYQLYQMQRNGLRPDATRGGKRGKRLELDRKDPYQPYDNLHNVVWCCYWCNNSKSNFFTEGEFRPIAEEIGKALRQIKTEN